MMTTAFHSTRYAAFDAIATSVGDLPLVTRLQRGDQAAFESLVRTHGGRLLSVARRFLGSNEDAEDAVQETFIKAFKSIHSFEERAQLHTWLHRIVVNTSLMKLRERWSKPQESIVPYGVSFHTYKKEPSLAVATLRPPFRVARFNADRTFSLLCANCANGTLRAMPFGT